MSCFCMGPLNKPLKTLVGFHLVGSTLTVDGLVGCQFVAQFQFQFLFVAMLGSAHAKSQHRILLPLFFHFVDKSILEQVFLSLEISLKCR